MAARFLLPALALAGSAVAATCSGTTTITNQAQATQLSSCQQWTGDIVIAGSAAGEIDLNGLQRIDGSLIAKNIGKLTTFTADSLSTISDTFQMIDVTALTTLTFPSLVAVDTINWQGLSSLQGLQFTQSVQKATNVQIVNTQLSSLDGIDLNEAAILILADNTFLNSVNMKLTNVTNALGFANNGPQLEISLPNLKAANNVAFRNVSSVSIPSLSQVTGSLGFYSSYFTTLSAANLSTVAMTLAVVGNPHLTSASFPLLTAVGGGVQIANNTALTNVDGFKKLSKVFGAVDMFGTFTSVALPALNYVKGAFYLLSSGDLGNSCTRFDSLHSSSAIRGSYECQGGQAGASTKGGSDGNSTSGGSSSSSSGHSGATSLIIPYTTGFIGVVAAIFGML